MAKTSLEIIGVYPFPAEEPVHLVEARIHNAAGVFDLGEVSQDSTGTDRANWQVPYMECILNEDGTEVIADHTQASLKGDLWKGDVRLAFFFHYLDINQKLKTPFGDVRLPRPSALPARLRKVEYEPPF